MASTFLQDAIKLAEQYGERHGHKYPEEAENITSVSARIAGQWERGPRFAHAVTVTLTGGPYDGHLDTVVMAEIGPIDRDELATILHALSEHRRQVAGHEDYVENEKKRLAELAARCKGEPVETTIRAYSGAETESGREEREARCSLCKQWTRLKRNGRFYPHTPKEASHG